MSKRGDTYLRTLLIHGARSAIVAAQRKGKPNVWLSGLLARRHPNIAAVALANKNARTIWALLAHEREFRPDYVPRPAAASRSQRTQTINQTKEIDPPIAQALTQ